MVPLLEVSVSVSVSEKSGFLGALGMTTIERPEDGKIEKPTTGRKTSGGLINSEACRPLSLGG
jgi:hypothetical protein